MTDKDRKYYITHIALAIDNLASMELPKFHTIQWYAQAILNLAEKSDYWIANNQKQFDAILDEAKEINNRK